MIADAKKIKNKLGLKEVMIPTNTAISSNRSQYHEVIRNKKYQAISLEKEVEFSYHPYEYSFSECYKVT